MLIQLQKPGNSKLDDPQSGASGCPGPESDGPPLPENTDLPQNFRAAPSLNDDRQVWAPVPPECGMWQSGLVDS